MPEVLKLLSKHDAENIKVVLGGVVPKTDSDKLTELGVAAVFGPGTPILVAARDVLSVIDRQGDGA